MTSKRLLYLSLFVAAVVQLAVWGHFTWPYYFFPADDVRLLRAGANSYMPFFEACMQQLLRVWPSGEPPENILLAQALFANAVTATALGLLTFALCSSVWPALAAVAVFSTSGWPATYYFFASYAPLSAALATLTAAFLFTAYRDPLRAGPYLALGGLTCGFFLFSSSGAPVLTGFFLVVALYFRRRFFQFLAPLLLGVLVFVRGWPHIFRHLLENKDTYHYQEALARFQYVPRPPAFTFFRIVHVSSPILATALVLVALALIFKAIRVKGFRRAHAPILVLGALVIAHALAVDLLPFTKLARTHFAVFPLAVALTASGAYALIPRLNGPAMKAFGAALAAVALGLIATQVDYSRGLMATRLEPQEFFASLPQDAKLFGENGDPHAIYIAKWLKLKARGTTSIAALPPRDGSKPAPYVFILGPHGKLSGRSVLRHSTLPDFQIDPAKIARPTGAREFKFPFYGYHPAFLMEEEISQALYFEGAAPNRVDSDLQLTIWVW